MICPSNCHRIQVPYWNLQQPNAMHRDWLDTNQLNRTIQPTVYIPLSNLDEKTPQGFFRNFFLENAEITRIFDWWVNSWL